MNKVIVLVGNIGSGKSTWSAEKIKADKEKSDAIDAYPTYINQDVLGSRDRCLKAAEASIEAGLDVIIDRTNMSKKQRNHWIQLAKKYKAEIHCVEFKISKEKCLERVLARKDHPTIKNMSKEKILSIIDKFEKEYELIEASEGFNSHIIISDVE